MRPWAGRGGVGLAGQGSGTQALLTLPCDRPTPASSVTLSLGPSCGWTSPCSSIFRDQPCQNMCARKTEETQA